MESEGEIIAKTKTNGNPPAKPRSDDSEFSGEAPEEFDGERPEMPSGMNCDDEEGCEMPEMPDDMEGMMQGGPAGPNGFPGEMMLDTSSSDNILHPVAYLSLGAGSLILSLVIMYSCFSNFYHKKPGQTFNTLQKFIWFIIATIALTAGLIALCYFIPIWTA